MQTCYCHSLKQFSNCCEPFLNGLKKAPSAETLMRSRYSAYVLHNATYLIATTHQSTRKHHQREAILEWATTNQLIKLELIQATESTVRFRATYLDEQLQLQVHQEFSTFVFEKEEGFYVDGNFD